jgi:hypothetical protein
MKILKLSWKTNSENSTRARTAHPIFLAAFCGIKKNVRALRMLKDGNQLTYFEKTRMEIRNF